MRTILVVALLMLPRLCFAEKYVVRDAGDFQPSGQRVEFADRYGWRSYQVEFDFGLDPGGRTLAKGSKLKVSITRRSGRQWMFACKAAKGRDALSANVNFLYAKGISVVAECRIPEKEFAKAVDLDPHDVGVPNLVFQAIIQDNEVRIGAQRGIYFLPGGQIESSELNGYAANNQDGLAVVFRSN